MKEPYSKHKDRDPQDTVDSIVEMLEQAGLDTEMRWTSHPFEGLCSNRVTIAVTCPCYSMVQDDVEPAIYSHSEAQ